MRIGTIEGLTRVGFAARGLIYFLIGYLALRTGQTEDGRGVLDYLGSGAGRLLIGVMAVGLLAYAVWRLTEALLDTEGKGTDGKGLVARAAGAVSGLLHLSLGLYAAAFALGRRTASTGGGGMQEGTSTALALPAGGAVVLVAAVALGAAGLYQFVKAYRLEFLKNLDPAAARQAWIAWLGRAGLAARGVVFTIMAIFLFQAGRMADAGQAGDIGAALDALPAGVRALVAAGLLLFGVFSLVEARYRRINDPQVVDRLKGMAHR